jgi:hypothetical protein
VEARCPDVAGEDYEASAASAKLNEACDNCHKVYRDKGGAEEVEPPDASSVHED